MAYHHATGLVVEDGCLQFKLLAADNGVRQAELQEEGLEHSDLLPGSQAKTLRGHTESLCLPSGDGVRDGEGHIRLSGLSGGSKGSRTQIQLTFTHVV